MKDSHDLDNISLDEALLFDDWATRNPAIYARIKRAYAFSFVVIGVSSLIVVIASFFFVYLLIVVLLFALAFFCLLYEFLRIENGHLEVYKDKIIIVNAFKNKKVIPYVKEETSLMLKRTLSNRPVGIVMSFLVGDKVVAEYKDYVNCASMYQEPKTVWEIALKSLGLKIIDPHEIIKND